jgi:hypothetical protein
MGLGLIACVLASTAIIANSWNSLSGTVDEPYHIANGLGWLENGTQLDFQQPPLAQALVALGLHLQGVHFPAGNGDSNAKGLAILEFEGHYRHSLTLARLGALPFFLLSCSIVWMWGCRWYSTPAAACALLLFISLPPVLAHSGLATIDMAAAATVVTTLYAFMRCIEAPSRQRLVLLGVAIALAFLSKFSSIGFLCACFVCAFAFLALRSRGYKLRLVAARGLGKRISLVGIVAFICLWAGYRFSFHSPAYKATPYKTIDHDLSNEPRLRGFVYKAITVPIPLSEFLRGVYEVASHDETGSDSYLLGHYRKTGWWYFFPVVISVKTPIAFLALSGCGIILTLLRFGFGPWQQQLTLIFAGAIMAVGINSRIDLGVRHILPIYPLLALVAGYGTYELLLLTRRISPFLMALPVLLMLWAAADAWLNRSDELAYFNYLAGSRPEQVLAESDLDWGQDLYKLSTRLRELGVDHVSIKYFGTAPLDEAGLPPYSILSSEVPTTHGFAAVSIRYMTLQYAKDGSFAWLKKLHPIETVGKSIYLYDLNQ